MVIKEQIEELRQFREAIYQSFDYRADALLDLLDALSSNSSASSVVELSLNPLFSRNYSSLHKAIDDFSATSTQTSTEDEKQQRLKLEKEHLEIIAQHIPALQKRRYHLLVTDITPQPRPFAKTLKDRKVVHSPNPAPGNKPITIGHEYSHLVYLPQKAETESAPWVIPLSVRRVSSKENGIRVGASQLADLINNPTLGFANELCLNLGDGSYSAVHYLNQAKEYENLVIIARLRSNRSLYFQPQPIAEQGKGHPTWYGQQFKLKNAGYYQSDQTLLTTYTSSRGRTFSVRIKALHNLLMRGKKDCPMHTCPLTLIRIEALKPNGKLIYRRPLYLVVAGHRREQLSLLEIWLAYARRYDIEHYFRFGKQRLLLSCYQTPDTDHEENWWQLCQLAYVQLFLAAPLAQRLPRPWDAKNISNSAALLSPRAVQQDFSRIICQIGTPAKAPKLRGKSIGRQSGVILPKRKWRPIVFKSKKEVFSRSSRL
jgi:hypothetical protein